MNLSDILPLEKWIELEQNVNRMSGLDTNVFDVKGFRITDVKNWANRLCPAIKATDKGQSYICAVAHMNLAAVAQNTREAIVEECDAGLVKLVVPIFVKDEFIGAFGACGLLLENSEVDVFLINKTAGIEEDKIERLSADIAKITNAKAQKIMAYIQTQIDGIVSDFEKQK